jgi:hypothetical protein
VAKCSRGTTPSFISAFQTRRNGYGHQNPLRVESVTEALAIDARILRAWDGHPRRYLIDAASDFLSKAERAVEVLKRELPECCRSHIAATRTTAHSTAPNSTLYQTSS